VVGVVWDPLPVAVPWAEVVAVAFWHVASAGGEVMAVETVRSAH